MHPGRGDVVAEHPAELVVGHPAQEAHPRAQRRRHRAGIGRRAATALLRGWQGRIESLGRCGVDQRHRPLVHGMARQECLGHLRHHVDNCVADAKNVEAGRFGAGGHRRHLLWGAPAYHPARARATAPRNRYAAAAACAFPAWRPGPPRGGWRRAVDFGWLPRDSGAVACCSSAALRVRPTGQSPSNETERPCSSAANPKINRSMTRTRTPHPAATASRRWPAIPARVLRPARPIPAWACPRSVQPLRRRPSP